ncbi:MAG: hypothetical protein AB1646_15355 [Thermodesulfobacteriota bacterium]
MEKIRQNIGPEGVPTEAACIPIPDTVRGESVKAFIVLNREYVEKISEKEIIDWAKEKMAAYKCPRVIEFRGDLPKSLTGKILRRLLREEEDKCRGNGQ